MIFNFNEFFMAQGNKSLFHWNRLDSNNGVKKKKGSSSINDWIKKVQNASEAAVQEALGDEVPDLGFDDFIPDDEAVYEAQELVNCWAKETSITDIENELKYRNEGWNSIANSSNYRSAVSTASSANDFSDNNVLDEMKSKYFQDLNDEEEVTNRCSKIYENNFGTNEYKSYVSLDSYTPIAQPNNYDSVDGIDETLLVQDILQGMLSKDFQKNIDLDLKPLSKKATNPVPKMNIRHEQVKIRGAKRRKNNLEKKKEKLSKEDIVQRARDRVINEERKRIEREKAEEKAILSEMDKIKLQLAEEKQKKEEEMKVKERILNEAKLQMQLELRQARQQEILKRKEEKEMKLQIERELQKEALNELQLTMKILHKYFSAWYDLVLQQRLKLGKALAVADWKCKMRAWNAWRSYVCCVKANQEARAIENAMKEKYRKEQTATNHARKMILFKCFIGWKKFTRYKSEKALLELERKETSKKIALFLEAASTGSLWSDDVEKEKDLDSNQNKHTLLEKQNNISGIGNVIISNEKVLHREKKIEINNTPSEKAKDTTKKPPIKSKFRVISMEAVNRGSAIDYEQLDESNSKKTPLMIDLNQNNIVKPTRKKIDKMKVKTDARNEDLCREKVNPVEKSSTSGFQTDRSEASTVSSEISATSSRQRIGSGKQSTKPLHLAMEEREKERQAKKAAIQGEKRRKEEEKLALLKAKEAERLRHEQLEKEEQIRIRKDQKKLELQKQKEKELQIEQTKLKNIIAKEHYQKVILKKYGINPLKNVVEITKLNLQISDKYHNSNLSGCCLIEWHLYTKEISSGKRKMAEECYELILKKRAFNSWLKCRFYLQNMNEIARTFSIKRTLKRSFGAWQEYVTDERILMWAKESTAEEHYTDRMVNCYFKTWKRYVTSEKEKRKRELRKEGLRKKVQGWLPDYKGDTVTMD